MNLQSETRTTTILRHVQQYLRETGTDWCSFGQTVAETYMARTPLHLRTIHFYTGGDACRAIKNNRQLVQRMLEDDVRLPADLEEAVVYALPADYGDTLLRDLAARYKLLAVEIPAAAGPHKRRRDIEYAARVSSQAGALLHELAEMLLDGEITAEDRAAIARAEPVMRALEGEIASLRACMTRAVHPEREDAA